jgi:hypothetical protein
VKQEGCQLQAISYQLEQGGSTLKDLPHIFSNGFDLDKYD